EFFQVTTVFQASLRGDDSERGEQKDSRILQIAFWAFEVEKQGVVGSRARLGQKIVKLVFREKAQGKTADGEDAFFRRALDEIDRRPENIFFGRKENRTEIQQRMSSDSAGARFYGRKGALCEGRQHQRRSEERLQASSSI
ncbi:hypothetical protein, partial [Mailhella sp.]|uniref:hypothetical protein n=1 Tax=Mailhella sp. TaxID=1981029 RepID=UPI003AB27EB2